MHEKEGDLEDFGEEAQQEYNSQWPKSRHHKSQSQAAEDALKHRTVELGKLISLEISKCDTALKEVTAVGGWRRI